MTLHKLSAGTGYEYLTRQVAALDSTEKGTTRLADYYAAKGEAPGRWVGSGLAGLDGIEAGGAVTAEQMKHLFGTGSHPVTGQPLGAVYKTYGNAGVDGFNVEVARLLESLNAASGRPAGFHVTSREAGEVRTEVARVWFVREYEREPASARELSAALARYSRPRQKAVAGYDLTFSPVKSVSVLWAVAPPEVAQIIQQAHEAAVADALAFIEREVLFTREGKDGARQIETRGLIATAFLHRDSRAGDPDLHTHVAVANKVQTREGKWLSIYGRVLHQHVVAASETYNTALEHHLVEGLGLEFAERPGGPREKRPVREVVGVDLGLCDAWSSRRADIVARQRVLAREFQQAQGRPPTPVESVALAQQANLETREAKHEPRSLADQRTQWRAEVIEVLGSEEAITAMVRAALYPPRQHRREVSAAWVRDTAERVIAEVEAHRATWQTWHVRAEAQRQVRGAAVPAGRVAEVVGWIVDHAVDRLSVNLTPDGDLIVEPEQLCRSDGTSVYRHTGHDHYSSQRVLDAEVRIVAAAARTGGVASTTDDVEVSVLAARRDGVALNPGQQRLVTAMATSGRRVQLALAPAGAGKTTAMRVLAGVWTEGGGDVLGLAPSAAAAVALRDATGMPCETLAKLTHDLTSDAGSALAESIGPKTLVVIDEAGMADTLTLDRVIGYGLDRGASVRLIGDDQQLAAIGAGGVLRDLAATPGALRLERLVRFTDPMEAEASLALREGDTTALGYYLDHNRVHVGDTATCLDETFAAWQRERAGGRDCLMLAPTRELVTELNQRARAARLTDNPGPFLEVALHDGTHASPGDVIITRRNDRRLGTSGTDWVKNGDRWTITAARGGSLSVRHVTSGLHAMLPAAYVAEHVELGYASTVHTAQGLTADVTHGLVTGEENRQLLYTMLSRGRVENHAHVVLATDEGEDQLPLPGITEQLTATELLEGILGRDGAANSATTTARVASSPERRLCDAALRYADAVAHACQRILGPDWDEVTGGAAPLPWLPDIPDEVRENAQWGQYVAARSRLVARLAEQVRQRDAETEPTWARQYADVLDAHLRADVAVWRAAQGIPDDERRITGPPATTDAEAAYQRRLVRRVNERYGEQVSVWERRIIECVRHRDQHTTDLARQLDRLERRGIDAERLLDLAASRRPLPDDHATAALAYRVRDQLKPPRRRRAPAPTEPYRSPPSSQAPGIGF